MHYSVKAWAQHIWLGICNLWMRLTKQPVCFTSTITCIKTRHAIAQELGYRNYYHLCTAVVDMDSFDAEEIGHKYPNLSFYADEYYEKAREIRFQREMMEECVHNFKRDLYVLEQLHGKK